MSTIALNQAFSDAVAAAVGEAESHTDAEIVVVAVARSESYRDISLLYGCGAVWAALVFLLFSPFEFSGLWMPVELPIIGALAGYIAHRSPAALRLLISARRQQTAVETRAAASFCEETVRGTQRRTGVLVYLSVLEQRVHIIMDGGIEARVPCGEINQVQWGGKSPHHQLRDLEAFIAGLHELGTVLARHVPAMDENPNELPDAPRVLS